MSQLTFILRLSCTLSLLFCSGVYCWLIHEVIHQAVLPLVLHLEPIPSSMYIFVDSLLKVGKLTIPEILHNLLPPLPLSIPSFCLCLNLFLHFQCQPDE